MENPIFWIILGIIFIGMLFAILYANKAIKLFTDNMKDDDDDNIDYSKNHPHIEEIIEICLENDRMRYEDLVQIDILDPTTDEYKFELIAKSFEKLSHRIGELEIKNS